MQSPKTHDSHGSPISLLENDILFHSSYFKKCAPSEEWSGTISSFPVEEDKNEMRVGTWPADPEEGANQQLQAFSSLSEALATLLTPPKENIVTIVDAG
ncbi:hypothetical protein BLNAU_22064 [Blattamonas nauphoetae]|uniref:Uncharacterized protein n=1 Tax=Blattamonas nauphoetae TaxID=2049346 RepID=A0ABQ9WU46_9EUKA|nr:hypothetical protein BLNAU_22064 [Blattamonas nauphoetae]